MIPAGATEFPNWSAAAGAGAGEVRGNPQETDEVPLQLAFQVRFTTELQRTLMCLQRQCNYNIHRIFTVLLR